MTQAPESASRPAGTPQDKPIEGEFTAETGKELVATPPTDMLALREPEEIIAEAQARARALDKVLKAKPKPVIIRGEHYLEISDWGLVAQFYGAAAYTDWTRPIDRTAEGLGRGWEARALVIDLKTGNTVGAAEAECLDSEEEWGERPEYKWIDEPIAKAQYAPEQIKETQPSKYRGRPNRCKVQVGVEQVPDAARRSMAQTRAGSRALAQRFRWVVALAGYKGTPAEEMPRSKYDSGGDYEPGDVVHTANARADQRAVTPMDPADVELIKNTVKVMIEQAKAGDAVAIAVQTAWTAWLTGMQGPGGPNKDTKATYDALFADDAYTYAAKRILGLATDAKPKAAPATTNAETRFDPDTVNEETAKPSPAPAAAPPRAPNEWPADEQKFIRDTYNAIVGIKKNASKRETPAAIAQATAVFNAFATWMNANKFNWSGEQGYTSIWKRYDQHDKVFELLGLAAPPPAPKPGFDPDEEAV